jgi:hypothetical protein
MPLTKSFNDLVQHRAASDPEFAAALRETARGHSVSCQMDNAPPEQM